MSQEIRILLGEHTEETLQQLEAELKRLGIRFEKRNTEAIPSQDEKLQLLNLAFEQVDLGITITGLDGKIIYTNPAEAHMHGYRPEDLQGKDVRIFAPRDLWKSMTHDQVREMTSWKRESVNIRGDGVIFPVQAISRVLSGSDGAPAGIVTISEDISDRKSSAAAFYDTLTGLPSKLLAQDRLSRSVKRIKRKPDYLFAVFFLDLDLFRKINQEHGYEFGDRLLNACARRIESCLRFGDTVARLDGDEFLVLLEDLRSLQDATFVADRVLQQLSIPFNMEGQEVFVTASIGIAAGSSGYDRPEDMIRDADTAMFRAKALGRDRYELYVPGQSRAMALVPLEIELRRGLENHELRVEYEPVIAIESGRIAAARALLLWNHSQRGVVYPDEFFPIAEETGLMDEVEEYMLRSICSHIRGWTDSGGSPVTVSARISMHHVLNKTFPERLMKILNEFALSPQVLEIEIKEASLRQNPEQITRGLKDLKAYGVGISLGNFGAGTFSLQSLKRFQFDSIRLDRSFLSEISQDVKSEGTAAAAIALAGGLKLRVIAEGVETEEEFAFFRWHHCDFVQGPLFGSSVSSDDFTRLLKENRKYISD